MRDDLEFNIEFCQEVQKYENLYDFNRPDYCLLHRIQADQTWETIAHKFSENPNSCKDRWKNIRGSYSKYKAKLNKSGNGTKTVKKYYLAPYLFFLDPFLKTREPKANIIENTVEIDESVVKNEAETSEGEDNYENCDDCVSVRSSLSSAPPCSNKYNSSLNDEATSEINKNGPPKQKDYVCRKRKNSAITFINKKQGYEYGKKRKQLLKIKDSTKTIDPPDPDLSFFHSVLPDMKSMNSSQKRHFKMGILDLAEQILSSISTTHQVAATSSIKLESKSP